MNRTGKISRLPHAIRTELNHRLENNIPGPVLLAWLNDLPEVRTILQDWFGGEPINKQNLSNWRRGGFLEWQSRQAFFDGLRRIADDAADFAANLDNITTYAARLAALHITRVLGPAEIIRGAEPPPTQSAENIKLICRLSHAAAGLQRSETAAARLHHQRHAAHNSQDSAVPDPSANTVATMSDPPAVKPGQGQSSPHPSAPSPSSSGTATPALLTHKWFGLADHLPAPSRHPSLRLHPPAFTLHTPLPPLSTIC